MKNLIYTLLVLLFLVGCTSIIDSSDETSFTSGTYLGHEWYVNDENVLYWDEKPYVPYATMYIPDVELDTPLGKDYHFWLDNDPGLFLDPTNVDTFTTKVTEAGGTYTVQFSKMHPPNYDASTLFDPGVKMQIIESWKPYISAIKKEGLRSITLWNEIDWAFAYPDSYTEEEYANLLNEYADEMRSLVGEVPIIFKMTTTPYINSKIIPDLKRQKDILISVGGKEGNGLGVDLFASSTSHYTSDGIVIFNSELKEKKEKTSVMWVMEFASAPEIGDEYSACYYDNFLPHSTKEEMRQQMVKYVDNGATGFLYAGPIGKLSGICSHLDYTNSHIWFSELEKEIKDKIVNGPKTPTDPSTLDELPTSFANVQVAINEPCRNTVGETGKTCNSLESCSSGVLSENCCIAGTCSEDSSCLSNCIAEGEVSDSKCKEICSGKKESIQEEETCTISNGEKGVTCESKEKCSSGEFVEGCCVGGGKCS